MITLITILLIVILVFGHEFGHFIAAKISGIRVDEFGIGFPPKIFSKKWGETEYSINAIPFGGFVRIHGENSTDVDEDHSRSFSIQPFYKKAFVIISGVAMNFLLAWVAFSIFFSVGISNTLIIQDVVSGSPADVAGFEPGERIQGFTDGDEFIAYIDSNLGKEILLNERTVTPRENPPEDEGALGIVFAPIEVEAIGPLQSIGEGFKMTIELTWLIILAFGSLIASIFTGNTEIVGQVAGPIGVFNLVREGSALGLGPLMQIMGLISLHLAVLNLVPFPALDGGRLLFIAIRDFSKGKILTEKTEAIVNTIGFGILILLMVLVTIRDIINL
ncbi:MAG: hypothetical protein COT88_01435 [Candidatus Colwellbacteria bacterium CG10_big_fil_rev_8_21_14_0_10_41_28]|uniref:Peptidase M50 domain-containing protein n=1 Tax=Candidatus Colwellbacteria bacterium CG10_big_fil_rev_8_21_14_0_10_41_28 TaxID=1974539 RepID=A0A2H0VJG6_9BACT|nr:MAG: hypothetical protein COT88_01435 [Candidatus Colwellbacteria bacterium CG10_big_fil_rev_8_21_14_0_10_41_28]